MADTILVTGGYGFIGRHLIEHLLNTTSSNIINLDACTYAARPDLLADNSRLTTHIFDLASANDVFDTIKIYKPAAIFHLAAESHVDRSIHNSMPFVQSNVVGTVNLLEAIRQHSPETLFVHVSTDEVYGSLCDQDPPSTETSRYNPRSPYAASKAAADHLVQAYHHTYNLKTIITNCGNNYGPGQHPEKLIPTIITNANRKLPIPIYGTGQNVRDWIFVTDHCVALTTVLQSGQIGTKYNIGANNPLTNLQVANTILDLMGESRNLIKMVSDRPGHDHRYHLDSNKMNGMGWQPQTTWISGLSKTIEWYKQ